MIDQDKMRALVAKLREDYEFSINLVSARYRERVPRTQVEAADAIDLLLAEVEAGKQQIEALLATVAECREKAFVEGYADSLLGAAVGSPDEVPGFVGQTVTELRAELEAAAADKRDAGRYRWLRDYPNNVNPTVYGVTLSLLRQGKYLDDAIDTALAQRQGEGS